MEANGTTTPTFEDMVRDLADRGFSRMESARILEMSYRKFQYLIKEMRPPANWRHNGAFVGQNESRKEHSGPTPARMAAIKRANAGKLAAQGIWYGEFFGLPIDVWRNFADPSVSFRCFRRRYYDFKWSLEDCLLTEAPRPFRRHSQKRKPSDDS